MNLNVQYQYAIDENDIVINIQNLDRKPEVRLKRYYCLSCNKQLRPVLGDIRQKHFRHLHSNVCNNETYLHNLSKRLFFQIYSQCLETNTSFDIALNQKVECVACMANLDISCELEQKLKRYSLSSLFTKITLEKYCDGFIADVLLENEKEVELFIEFAVTHSVSVEKVSSGKRIIEISITDEKCLKSIYEKLFSESNPKCKFINFKSPEPKIVERTNCNSKKRFFC